MRYFKAVLYGIAQKVSLKTRMIWARRGRKASRANGERDALGDLSPLFRASPSALAVGERFCIRFSFLHFTEKRNTV